MACRCCTGSSFPMVQDQDGPRSGQGQVQKSKMIHYYDSDSECSEPPPEVGHGPVRALLFPQEGDQPVSVEPADRGPGIREALGPGPARGLQVTQGDGPPELQILRLGGGEPPGRAPGHQGLAFQQGGAAFAGIGPGTDGGAVEPGQVGAAAQPPPQVPGQAAHVVAAPAGDLQGGGAGQIVGQPAGRVEIDPGRGQLDGLAAVGLLVGGLAVDLLGAGGGRYLVLPAQEGGQGLVQALRMREAGPGTQAAPGDRRCRSPCPTPPRPGRSSAGGASAP